VLGDRVSSASHRMTISTTMNGLASPPSPSRGLLELLPLGASLQLSGHWSSCTR
jgi:hypothetical protein